MAEARQLAEDLLKAVNEGAGSARALVVTLLVLAVYIFIVVSGTDDEQILRNSTVAVPALSNATVPASAFYAIMPWAFLFLHLDLLIHLLLLSEKLTRFNAAVAGLDDPVAERDMRLRLAGFPYANWLGRDPHAHSGLRRLQGVTVWASLVLLPLLALIYLQLGFLAYHSETITWGQRLALLADVGLLYYFWPRLLAGRYTPPTTIRTQPGWKGRIPRLPTRFLPRLPARLAGLKGRTPVAALIFLADMAGATLAWFMRRLWTPVLALLALPLVFISLLVATIPDEPADKLARRWMGNIHMVENRLSKPEGDAICHEVIGGLVERCDQVSLPTGLSATSPTIHLFHLNGSWFHRTLTVHDRVLAADTLRPEVVIKVRSTLRDMREGRETTTGGQTPMRAYEDAIFEVRGLDLRERDLRYADFSGSSFPGAQLDKAMLDHSRLFEIDLRKAVIRQSRLAGTYLGMATLTGADLSDATLTGTALSMSILTGTNFNMATLTGADLSMAKLTGANLSMTTLTGANLSMATLTGADLSMAKLTGADLRWASLKGANLSQADLIGANLHGAAQNGLIWDSKPRIGHLTRVDLDTALRTLGEAGLGSEKHEEIKARLNEWLDKGTTGLDFSACLGEGCDTARARLNAESWATVLRETTCPAATGKRTDWENDRLLTYLTKGIPDFSSSYSAIFFKFAAGKAMLDLVRGPCGKELNPLLHEFINYQVANEAAQARKQP